MSVPAGAEQGFPPAEDSSARGSCGLAARPAEIQRDLGADARVGERSCCCFVL